MAESGKKVAIAEPPRRKHSDDTSITEEQVTEMRGTARAPTAVTAGRDTSAGGVFGGCLGSVLMLFRKKPQKKVVEEDDREIDYDEIKDSLRFIGSGGQGAVYVGVHRGDPVAVKKVKEARDTDIAHLMRLKHPNIVQFRGVSTKAPNYCIIMEYCGEGSLYEVIQKRTEILPPEVIKWAGQIAGGMHFLHSKKLIHRDLKSANILVTHCDELKISDFGTSKKIGERSTPMTMIGTVAWMAPELIRGELCSEKVDIWSYGVLIWELLTMQRPYEQFEHSAIIYGVGTGTLNLPIPATCPEGLKHLMQICWAQKPRNRPSFKHIQMHLDIAAGEFIALPPQDYLETQAHWRSEIEQLLEDLHREVTSLQGNTELIRQRQEELKEVQDIKVNLKEKLDSANKLYEDLKKGKEELDARKEIYERILERRTSRKMSPAGEILDALSSSEEEEMMRPIVSISPAQRRQKRHSQCSSNISVSPLLPAVSPGHDRSKQLSFHSPKGRVPVEVEVEVDVDREQSGRRDEMAITPGGTVSPAVKKLLGGLRSHSSPHNRYGSLPRKVRRKGHMRNWSGGSVKSFDYVTPYGVAMDTPFTTPKGLPARKVRRSMSVHGTSEKKRSSPAKLDFSDHSEQSQVNSQLSTLALHGSSLAVREDEDILSSPAVSPTDEDGCEADESSDSEDEMERHRSPLLSSKGEVPLSNVKLLKTFYDKRNVSPTVAMATNNDSGFQTPSTVEGGPALLN